MRWRSLLAAILIVVGIAAIGLVVLGPVGGATPASQYLTATATRTNVVQSAAATGNIAPHATYGLAFGREATVTSGASSSSSTSSSSSAASSGNGTAWLVTTVAVQPGDQVTKGQLLASADDSASRLQLAVTQANLAVAEARLAADQAGATTAEDTAARKSIARANVQLAAARQNWTLSTQQHQLTVSRAQAAVTTATRQLASDQAAKKDAATIATDTAALTTAQQTFETAQLDSSAASNQASASISTAGLQITTAEDARAANSTPAAAAQIDADRMAVSRAATSASSAQTAVSGARLVAPGDGIVVAVNIAAGVNAPSGDAIRIETGPMELTASFAESDLPTLALNQPATVTVTAVNQDLTGKVSQILPVATSSGTSSVVTYTIVVSLDAAPPDVKSGMSAKVSVATATAANVIAVPTIALVGSNGSYEVRVLDANGQVQLRPVTVGLTTNTLAEIKSGLSEGDQVVTGTATARQNTTTTGGGGIGAFPVGGGGAGGGRNFRPGGGTQP